MPTPATSAQSHCTEAARAAALASHSAASLSAAAGFREAARLLRSSEALARAATAALLALPRSDTGAPTPGGDAPAGKKKKRRSKKKKDKDVAMDGKASGPEVVPLANDVDVAGVATASLGLSPSAVEFVPASGGAARVLAARPSRERSPLGLRAAPPAESPSASHQHGSAPVPAGTGKFSVGQAVVLVDLVSRADLVGKCGVVKSFDSASKRFAVCLDASGEHVKVLEGNLRPSIFVAGGGGGVG